MAAEDDSTVTAKQLAGWLSLSTVAADQWTAESGGRDCLVSEAVGELLQGLCQGAVEE